MILSKCSSADCIVDGTDTDESQHYKESSYVVSWSTINSITAVSYTHLDVYKRQTETCVCGRMIVCGKGIDTQSDEGVAKTKENTLMVSLINVWNTHTLARAQYCDAKLCYSSHLHLCTEETFVARRI